MFNISIAGFNTGGGNVNFKGFANHVYRLPHGRYGYHGHVTNLLQDIASFANSSFTFTILTKARPTMPCICLVALISLLVGAFSYYRTYVVPYIRCSENLTLCNLILQFQFLALSLSSLISRFSTTHVGKTTDGLLVGIFLGYECYRSAQSGEKGIGLGALFRLPKEESGRRD